MMLRRGGGLAATRPPAPASGHLRRAPVAWRFPSTARRHRLQRARRRRPARTLGPRRPRRRTDTARARARDGPAEPMLSRTILLPLDGSVFSEHALPAALGVARRSGAVLHLVHVYRPDEPWRDQEELTPYRFEGQPAYDDVYESADRRIARRYLAWVARQAEER